MFRNRKLEAALSQCQAERDDARAVLTALDRSLAIIEFTPDGTILSANEGFCALMGYTLAQLQGQHHRILCTADYTASPEYDQFWVKLRAGEYFRDKVKRVTKSGKELWLQATYNPVLDRDGRVTRIYKIATDITAREEEAELSHALVAAINRAMAVIEFDMNGRVRTANANFLGLMGYRLEEIQGRPHRDFCLSTFADSPEYAEFWARLGRGESFSGQFERVAKDGHHVWLEAAYNPVLDAKGQPIKVVKIASDITERVTQQQAEQASAKLAYDISKNTEGVSAQGATVIADTVAKMTRIAELVRDSSSRVEKLGQQSDQITSIVNTIKEIADQTNLLALNAAIEAARAGESGRGFSVVADEVRKLAERTSNSTTEIAAMIGAIQSDTRSVIDTMGTGLGEVDQGVTLVQEAGQAIQEIRSGAHQVVDAVGKLSSTLTAG